jgi:hypothetical protein
MVVSRRGVRGGTVRCVSGAIIHVHVGQGFSSFDIIGAGMIHWPHIVRRNPPVLSGSTWRSNIWWVKRSPSWLVTGVVCDDESIPIISTPPPRPSAVIYCACVVRAFCAADPSIRDVPAWICSAPVEQVRELGVSGTSGASALLRQCAPPGRDRALLMPSTPRRCRFLWGSGARGYGPDRRVASLRIPRPRLPPLADVLSASSRQPSRIGLSAHHLCQSRGSLGAGRWRRPSG